MPGGHGRLESLGHEALTYDEVGATSGALPAGYHHLRERRTLGRGEELFTAASRAIDAWEVQRRSGIRVLSSGATVAEGDVALLQLGPGRLAVQAPVRVVYTVNESHRRGFAYGTLPGHPERGEEAFVVELLPDCSVVFSVTAFSRPATRLSRVSGPVGRAAQRLITRRYLRALEPPARRR